MKSFYYYPIFLALVTSFPFQRATSLKAQPESKYSIIGTIKRYKKTSIALGLGGIVALFFLRKVFLKNNKPNLPDIPKNYSFREYVKQLLLGMARLIDNKKNISTEPEDNQILEVLRKIEYIQFGDKNNPESKPLIWDLNLRVSFAKHMDVFSKAINGEINKLYTEDVLTLEKITAIKKRGNDYFVPVDWDEIKEKLPDTPDF